MNTGKMKYRLSLKLGGGHEHGKAYLGWALIRLKEEKASSAGIGSIPAGFIQNAEELRIIQYADPADSLQPIPKATFEERVKLLSSVVDSSCKIKLIKFDKQNYQAWLGNKKDTQECRAEWANQLELGERNENDISCIDANR